MNGYERRVMGGEINVESAPGLVMIRGNMSSDETKNAAEGVANRIDGCKSVQSDVHVVRPSHCTVSKDNHEAVTLLDRTVPCQERSN